MLSNRAYLDPDIIKPTKALTAFYIYIKSLK